MISSRFRSTLAGILVAVACGGESLRESDAGGGGQGGSGTGGTRVKPTPGSSGGESTSGGRASAGEGSGGQANETGGQASESAAGQAGQGVAGEGGAGGDDSIELPPCPNPMVFEDPEVEQAVKNELGWAPIGPEDAATLTELQFLGVKHTTIDLRCFPSLEKLFVIEQEEPIDFSGLPPLSKLKDLTLYFSTLNLENTKPLEALTGLERLTLIDMKMVEDMSFLGKLTALRELWAEGTDIDIPSGIGNLPELTALLFSSASGDLSALAEAKNLKTLTVQGTLVADITPLAQVTSLETLDLSYNKVSDPTPIVALPNLKSVNFYRCGLKDLTPLTQLTHNLEWLNLGLNPLIDCEAQQANLAIIREKVTELLSDCPEEP